MARKTDNPRDVVTVRTRANRWAITGFDVRTPQDGSPNSVHIYAESWEQSGSARLHVTAMGQTDIVGNTAIAAVLTRIGEIYEEQRAAGVDHWLAQYNAMKLALEEVKIAVGDFPDDAT